MSFWWKLQLSENWKHLSTDNVCLIKTENVWKLKISHNGQCLFDENWKCLKTDNVSTENVGTDSVFLLKMSCNRQCLFTTYLILSLLTLSCNRNYLVLDFRTQRKVSARQLNVVYKSCPCKNKNYWHACSLTELHIM